MPVILLELSFCFFLSVLKSLSNSKRYWMVPLYQGQNNWHLLAALWKLFVYSQTCQGLMQVTYFDKNCKDIRMERE